MWPCVAWLRWWRSRSQLSFDLSCSLLISGHSRSFSVTKERWKHVYFIMGQNYRISCTIEVFIWLSLLGIFLVALFSYSVQIGHGMTRWGNHDWNPTASILHRPVSCVDLLLKYLSMYYTINNSNKVHINSTLVVGYKRKRKSIPCAYIQPWLWSKLSPCAYIIPRSGQISVLRLYQTTLFLKFLDSPLRLYSTMIRDKIFSLR